MSTTETPSRSVADSQRLTALARTVKEQEAELTAYRARALRSSSPVPSRRDRPEGKWQSNRLTLASDHVWSVNEIPLKRFSVGATFGGWLPHGDPWEIEVGGHVRRTVQSEAWFVQLNYGRRALILRRRRARMSDR